MIKFYEVIAIPVFTYGSEVWITEKQDHSRVQVEDIFFLRRVKVGTLVNEMRCKDIRRDLQIVPDVDTIIKCKKA